MKNVNKTTKIRLTLTVFQTSVTPRNKRNSKFEILRLTSFLTIPLMYNGFIDQRKHLRTTKQQNS